MEKRSLRAHQAVNDIGDLDKLIRDFEVKGLRGIQSLRSKKARKPGGEEPDLEILRRNYPVDPHRE